MTRALRSIFYFISIRYLSARFDHRTSRSEIRGSRALRSVFYVLYIQFTKFVTNIFLIFRVEYA